jgi:hypothetical protein
MCSQLIITHAAGSRDRIQRVGLEDFYRSDSFRNLTAYPITVVQQQPNLKYLLRGHYIALINHVDSFHELVPIRNSVTENREIK